MDTTTTNTKNIEERYENVIKYLTQMKNEFKNPPLSQIAKMASISSCVKSEFPEFSFVGFYIVVKHGNSDSSDSSGNENIFIEIGPYVAGIIATPRIEYGKGVCGESWEKKKTMVVNNVKACNNYIACSKNVKSEVVIPVIDSNGDVTAVFDIDCTVKDKFTDLDKEKLEYIIKNFC